MKPTNQKELTSEKVLLSKNQEESFNQFYFKSNLNIDAFSLCTSCGEACDCDCPCQCSSICDCDCSCPSCPW